MLPTKEKAGDGVKGGGSVLELFREKEVVRICAPMVRYSK